MASKDKFEDLDLSKDEVKRIGEALKNEEFRKLLGEYAQEISNPENKARYEAEIQEMEANRGMDVEFVHPEPGYVMKAMVEGKHKGKAFINVAQNKLVAKPTMERKMGPSGQSGMSWQLPHSLAPPREDVDNKSDTCTVFDFVIHPDTYRMAETNARFKKMIEDTAFDAMENAFEVKFDRKNVKFPKLKFKGTPQATVIRTKKDEGSESKENKDPDDPLNKFPYPYDDKTTAERSKEAAAKAEQRQKQEAKTKRAARKQEDEFTEPSYSIKHRNELDMSDFRNSPDSRTSTRPTQLVVDIRLPLCKSAAGVDLDIFDQRLVLQYSKTAKYKLDLRLPYPVDESEGSAKFDKAKKTLVVTLPVIPDKTPVKLPFTGENMADETPDAAAADDSPLNSDAGNPGLIEVISSQDFSATKEEPQKSEAPSEEPKVGGGSQGQSDSSDLMAEVRRLAAAQAQAIATTLPEFDYNQDHETVSIILAISNAKRDKVSVEHTANTCTVKVVSVGEGGFPIHYRFHVQFPANCTFEQNNVQTDISPDNVVLLLEKCDESIGLWDTFKTGKDQSSLEEKLFLTVSNVQKELDALDKEQADIEGAGRKDDVTPQFDVTDMDKNKLSVQIKNAEEAKGKRKKRISESADDYEVVYERDPPQVPGILKQRSREQSESSCDEAIFGGPATAATAAAVYHRQHSSASFSGTASNESSLLESDEGLDSSGGSGGRKKTVSFSEHVDQASYKANASVNTLKATLKNKRKNRRKRDQKRDAKQQSQSRRRRTSSCSEPSSDEYTTGSSTGSLERSNSLDDLADNVLDTMDDIETLSAEELKAAAASIVLPPAAGGKSKPPQDVVTPSEGVSAERTRSEISAEDYGTTSSSSNAAAEPASSKGDSGSNQVSGSDANTANNSASNKPSNKSSNKKKRNRKNKKHNSDSVSSESSENEKNVSSNGVATTNGESGDSAAAQQPAENETMLSWEDRKEILDPLGQHAPACAISFSNSVIYDLDVE